MKKILSVMLMIGVVMSLAACNMNMTADERQQYIEEKQSQKVAQSIEAEEKYSAGVIENVEKLGKSEEGKRLVVKIPYAHGKLYRELTFGGKDGLCQKVRVYYFYDDLELYENGLKMGTSGRELVKKDKDARMVVFDEGIFSEETQTYEQVYETYLDSYFVESGYEIIE